MNQPVINTLQIMRSQNYKQYIDVEKEEIVMNM